MKMKARAAANSSNIKKTFVSYLFIIPQNKPPTNTLADHKIVIRTAYAPRSIASK
jgi:hypothetical protein